MKIKRILSMILVVVMVLALVPATVFASNTSKSSGNGLVPDHMTVTKDKVSTLAPGVIQHEVTLYDKNGARVEMLVAIADMNVETVDIYANYKDNQNQVLGMQKTTEQVAAFMKNHEGQNLTPVVAINASYYNTGNGRPNGAFVMEGIDVTVNGNNYPFFAVLKDGSVMIGQKGEYDTYKDQLKEAIGGHRTLVTKGEIVNGLDDSEKYPRQTIGITADNKVIIMTSDGNQSPVTIGMTIKEQAEVMYALGCVEALHLDGGGSATYCSKAEGSDELKLLNSPCDGSERAVSNTLLIVSTAVSDNTFNRANMLVDNEYITPNGTANVTAVGVSATGGTAIIPENAVWALEDDSFGTITDGKFVSNGKTGDVVVQLLLDGEVVGSTVIHVVIPTEINFKSTQTTCPFGKTINLVVTATVNEGKSIVKCNDGDIVLSLTDETIGQLNGNKFTAVDMESASATESTVVATFVGTEIKGTMTIKLGRGSEIAEDFEDGETSFVANGMYGAGEVVTSEIVTSENGEVRNGDSSLAIHLDYNHYTVYSGRGGFVVDLTSLKGIKGATAVGFWMYFPGDLSAVNAGVRSVPAGKPDKKANRTDTEAFGVEFFLNHELENWYYITFDISNHPTNENGLDLIRLHFYLEDAYVAGNYVPEENDTTVLGKYTIYIDDFTIDYSDAVEDREVPVFDGIDVFEEGTAGDPVKMNGQTLTTSTIFVSATAKDFIANNSVGLDMSSAKAFIDGVEVTDKLVCNENGMMLLSAITLTDGAHTFRFEICDNNGNPANVERYIVIDSADSEPLAKIEMQDPTANNLLAGSIHWLDLTVKNIDKINEFTTVINLNGINNWNLGQIIVADGFDVEYSINTITNDVTFTFTRNGRPVSTEDDVLMSFPVRIWYSKYAKEDNEAVWERHLVVKTDLGVITYADGTVETFSMTPIKIHTECNESGELMAEAGITLPAWHNHTAEAIADGEATCLTHGYTGRTYCAGCNSVVDWGTKTTEAKGHNYTLVEGVLTCECGAIFSGVYSDGKTYVDGVSLAGWVGDSYYDEGVLAIGVQKIDGYYYDFGENGVCAGKSKFTGLFFNEELNAYSYAKVGVISTGWINHEDNWYYFLGNGKAASGHFDSYFFSYGVSYDFEETGKLVDGVWHKLYVNGKYRGMMYFYGPDCYKNCWQEIDGNRYYFDGVLRAEGPHMIMESLSRVYKCFVFANDGVYTGEEYTGFVTTGGYLYYVENNIARNGGMFELNGDLYYAHSDGKLAVGSERISRGNGYVVDYGTYSFEENGKLYNGVYTVDGESVYYYNGLVARKGVYYNVAGDYYVYVINSKGKLATGLCDVPANDVIEAGQYLIAEDGKFFTGTAKEGADVYFYRHGQKQGRGVYYVADGDYYVYVRSTGTCAVGYYSVKESAANGLLAPQYYMFGDDGKLMDLTGVASVNGKQYYFIDGAKQGRGMYYNEEGDYYVYVKSDESVVTGYYYCNKTNDLLPQGYYMFDETGRSLTGVVEENGNLYYYEHGIKQGRGVYYNKVGDYYVYVRSTGIVATGKYEVKESAANGLLIPQVYLFDENGRTVTGIVEEDGKLFYYIQGAKQGRGMYYNADGNYYVYVNSSGACVTGKYYVNATNDLLPKATYDFGTDGKFVLE